MSKNSVQGTHSTDPLDNIFNESVNQVFFYNRQIGDLLESEWIRYFKEDQFYIEKTQGNIKSQLVLTEINENKYVIQEKLVDNNIVKIQKMHVVEGTFKGASNNFKRYLANHEAYFQGEQLLLLNN